MWGTDQAMSLESRGMNILRKNIREFEIALGNSDKVLYENEILTLARTIEK
jgi:sialic acid synthase SpsE